MREASWATAQVHRLLGRTLLRWQGGRRRGQAASTGPEASAGPWAVGRGARGARAAWGTRGAQGAWGAQGAQGTGPPVWGPLGTGLTPAWLAAPGPARRGLPAATQGASCSQLCLHRGPAACAPGPAPDTHSGLQCSHSGDPGRGSQGSLRGPCTLDLCAPASPPSRAAPLRVSSSCLSWASPGPQASGSTPPCGCAPAPAAHLQGGLGPALHLPEPSSRALALPGWATPLEGLRQSRSPRLPPTPPQEKVLLAPPTTHPDARQPWAGDLARSRPHSSGPRSRMTRARHPHPCPHRATSMVTRARHAQGHRGPCRLALLLGAGLPGIRCFGVWPCEVQQGPGGARGLSKGR